MRLYSTVNRAEVVMSSTLLLFQLQVLPFSEVCTWKSELAKFALEKRLLYLLMSALSQVHIGGSFISNIILSTHFTFYTFFIFTSIV